MALARQLLAALLAVLIANPVCCCSLGAVLGKTAGNHDTAPISSCCSKKSCPIDKQAPQSPGEAPSCPCGMDDSMVSEAKLSKLERAAATDLKLELPLTVEIQLRWNPERTTVARRSDPPPPGVSWRLYCRYLL